MGSGLGLTIESPGFDVAAGEVQKPGDVPAIVINELKSTIRGMPEKKNTQESQPQRRLKKSRRLL